MHHEHVPAGASWHCLSESAPQLHTADADDEELELRAAPVVVVIASTHAAVAAQYVHDGAAAHLPPSATSEQEHCGFAILLTQVDSLVQN